MINRVKTSGPAVVRMTLSQGSFAPVCYNKLLPAIHRLIKHHMLGPDSLMHPWADLQRQKKIFNASLMCLMVGYLCVEYFLLGSRDETGQNNYHEILHNVNGLETLFKVRSSSGQASIKCLKEIFECFFEVVKCLLFILGLENDFNSTALAKAAWDVMWT